MRPGEGLPADTQLCSKRVERFLQRRLESDAITVAQPGCAIRVLRGAVGRKWFYRFTGRRRKRGVWLDRPKLLGLLGLRTAEGRTDRHRAGRSQVSKPEPATSQERLEQLCSRRRLQLVAALVWKR